MIASSPSSPRNFFSIFKRVWVRSRRRFKGVRDDGVLALFNRGGMVAGLLRVFKLLGLLKLFMPCYT